MLTLRKIRLQSLLCPHHPTSGLRYLSTACQRDSARDSYVCGETTPPLVNKTIPSFFKDVIQQHGDRECVVSRFVCLCMYGTCYVA